MVFMWCHSWSLFHQPMRACWKSYSKVTQLIPYILPPLRVFEISCSSSSIANLWNNYCLPTRCDIPISDPYSFRAISKLYLAMYLFTFRITLLGCCIHFTIPTSWLLFFNSYLMSVPSSMKTMLCTSSLSKSPSEILFTNISLSDFISSRIA